jgi:hypothetical protein
VANETEKAYRCSGSCLAVDDDRLCVIDRSIDRSQSRASRANDQASAASAMKVSCENETEGELIDADREADEHERWATGPCQGGDPSLRVLA